ncbi:MAG: flagellar hook-basal body complex protein FliE [Gammaproteobacteria bacterium]|nr:flagellar hook-basal body complex protein FliE [Gammaproteobacteria bacterium]
MADIDVNQIMTQMRAMAAAAQTGNTSRPAENPQGADFSALLRQSLDQVNGAQATSKTLVESFTRGDPNTDLTQVMIATQKASLSFQAITEVRNKLVQAYQDVMNMPV